VAKIESWIRDKELMVSQVRNIFYFRFEDFSSSAVFVLVGHAAHRGNPS
jgi:hypothetical protein